MSTIPNVPYRLEFSVEVPGTPEQVWDAIATATRLRAALLPGARRAAPGPPEQVCDAIATAKGMSAWFLPTEIDEREGGSLHFAMGPEMGSDGQGTGWGPPRRGV